MRLDVLCRMAISARMTKVSEEFIYDLAEENMPYVAEHLRDCLADAAMDGYPCDFEIDSRETPPYIRLRPVQAAALLGRLGKIDPFDFEKVCAEILSRLGAKSEVTKRTQDGGVDFIAVDFDFVPDEVATPQACRAVVIGQAKRFKDGNLVRETDVRAFIGGAIQRRGELLAARAIFPLSPAIYAFWTTSDFEPNAKKYAQTMGIWYMGGRLLSEYVRALGLEDFLSTLEHPADPSGSPAA